MTESSFISWGPSEVIVGSSLLFWGPAVARGRLGTCDHSDVSWGLGELWVRVTVEGGGSTGASGLPETGAPPRGRVALYPGISGGDESVQRGAGPAEHSMARCSLQPWA